MLTAPQQRLVAEHAGLGDQATRHLRHEDRIGIANLAVVEAATRWEPDRGATFSTFAGRRARGAIAERRRTESRMSRRDLQILYHVELAGHALSPSDVAATATQFTAGEILKARAAHDRATVLHIDQPLEPGAEDTLGDVANQTPDHAQAIVDRLALVQAVARLDERHRKTIVLRFFAGWPHAVIARMFGVTDSAVSHIQRSALDKLRTDIEHMFD